MASSFTLTHCDISGDNLLVHSDLLLSGVVDFEHARMSAPARDSAAPRYFSVEFCDAVMREYVRLGSLADSGVRASARTLLAAICRLFDRPVMEMRRDAARAGLIALRRQHNVLGRDGI